MFVTSSTPESEKSIHKHVCLYFDICELGNIYETVLSNDPCPIQNGREMADILPVLGDNQLPVCKWPYAAANT